MIRRQPNDYAKNYESKSNNIYADEVSNTNLETIVGNTADLPHFNYQTAGSTMNNTIVQGETGRKEAIKFKIMKRIN